MDIQNVFVIVSRKIKKIAVVKDIMEEGYKHNFYFADSENFNEMVKQLNISDEVWVFGDCDNLEIFKYVERNGEDVWRMA